MTGNTRKSSFFSLALTLLLATMALVMAVQAAMASGLEEVTSPVAAQEGDVCSLTVSTVGNGTVSETVTSEDPDLRAQVADDWSFVILENSQIYVRYDWYNEDTEFAIRQFRIKDEGNENQLGNYLDADAGRGALVYAELIYDGSDRKTVRLEWSSLRGGENIVHEVSIFPNGRFLKIDYINVRNGIMFVDLAKPGGVMAGEHVAYGAEDWIRGYVTFDVSTETQGSYYNRYPGDKVNDPADGGSLNYNGHFILGNFNPANGNGYGRALPVADIGIIKLLLKANERRGFEIYPHPFFQSHAPFTGYLYAVTGGAEDAIAYGQRLADSNGTDFGYQCGDTVELLAEPAPDWGFDGWTGDITGTDNPATIVLTGEHQVIANFSADQFTLDVTTVPGDGSGGTVTKNPDKPFYEVGETVELTAAPQPGWTFVGWSGDLSGTDLVKTLLMDENKSVTATFAQDEYSIVITTVGNGTVDVQPDKSAYVHGEQVTITAIPGANSFLTAWGGDLAPFGIANPIQLTVEDDIIGVAVFGDSPPVFTVYMPMIVRP